MIHHHLHVTTSASLTSVICSCWPLPSRTTSKSQRFGPTVSTGMPSGELASAARCATACGPTEVLLLATNASCRMHTQQTHE